MMNKPIFILSDSYQKYANFRSNTDFNAQSVAFLNIKGEESILLGPDLDNTRFRFVPDAPKTNSDLVLKSNNGIFSWVAFPTGGGTGGSTTIVNEGIKPPFELREESDGAMWSYYIRTTNTDGNTQILENLNQAPVGTIFTDFDFNSNSYRPLPENFGVSISSSYGYRYNYVNFVPELGYMIEYSVIKQSSVPRLFVFNSNNDNIKAAGVDLYPLIGEAHYFEYISSTGGLTIKKAVPKQKGEDEKIVELANKSDLTILARKVNTLESKLNNGSSDESIDPFKLWNFQHNGLKSEKYTKILNGTREGITSHTLGISQLDVDMLPSTLELYSYLNSIGYFLPSGEDATDFKFQVGDLMKIDGVTGEVGKVFEVIHNVDDITKFDYSYLKKITEAFNDKSSSTTSRIIFDYINTIKKFISSNTIK